MKTIETTFGAATGLQLTCLAHISSPDAPLLFDIETTGLSADYARVYLIGCAFVRDGVWHMRQWFADGGGDEAPVIRAFLGFAQGFGALVHFNGDMFDLPFLAKRAARLGIPCRLPVTGNAAAVPASDREQTTMSAAYESAAPGHDAAASAAPGHAAAPEGGAAPGHDAAPSAAPGLDAAPEGGAAPAPTMKSTDIYKRIKPYRHVLGLDSLRQKSVENFLGIDRQDKYSGGELVDMYHAYLRTGNAKMYELLLLHNADDVRGMAALLPILSYADALDAALGRRAIPDAPDAALGRGAIPDAPDGSLGRGAIPDALDAALGRRAIPDAPDGSLGRRTPSDDFPSPAADITEDAIIFSMPAPFFPRTLIRSHGPYTLEMSGDTLRITARLFSGTLKYFYADVANYYYLPAEDTAIHKSVGAYVDRSARMKATVRTCYTKKAGVFFPQPIPIWEPVYSHGYKQTPHALLADMPAQSPPAATASQPPSVAGAPGPPCRDTGHESGLATESTSSATSFPAQSPFSDPGHILRYIRAALELLVKKPISG
ncbi:MAG: ribonuclease H-like domain-containing protein [Lachnospiraceae bacterium]|jgi:hypothetical protein|nr:ribonuclease H-like domain-containing protein [Lachnospiraceae bacterium]